MPGSCWLGSIEIEWARSNREEPGHDLALVVGFGCQRRYRHKHSRFATALRNRFCTPDAPRLLLLTPESWANTALPILKRNGTLKRSVPPASPGIPKQKPTTTATRPWSRFPFEAGLRVSAGMFQYACGPLALRPMRALNFIAAGPRSPLVPPTPSDHQALPVALGFKTIRDLPDMGQLEEAGLLSKQKLLGGTLPGDLSEAHDLINIEERAGEDVDAEEPRLALSSEDL